MDQLERKGWLRGLSRSLFYPYILVALKQVKLDPGVRFRGSVHL